MPLCLLQRTFDVPIMTFFTEALGLVEQARRLGELSESGVLLL